MAIRAQTAIFWILAVAVCRPLFAEQGDALIQYHLGLAAQASGDINAATALFKQACMADDGVSAACILWGRLAEKEGDTGAMKRAYASAVMLSPDNVEARVRLAVMLIKNQDYLFATEHLNAALTLSKDRINRSLIRYYLGIAALKSGDTGAAVLHFKAAKIHAPPLIKERCAFFLGQTAAKKNDYRTALVEMRSAAETSDSHLKKEAKKAVNDLSAFPLYSGLSARLSASLGFNSHPSSAFLDDVGQEEGWVMQSIFRGDASFKQQVDDIGFGEALTAYREQNWLTFGSSDARVEQGIPVSEASRITPEDLNLTLLMTQLSFERRFFGRHVEHDIKLGADAETQFLDALPKKTVTGDYTASEFGMHTWAVGGRIGWSFAKQPDSVYSMRFNAEIRPNYVDRDRSSIRFRWRMANSRFYFHRTLNLETLLGVRFDRTYRDPAVIRYDRLLPELEVTSTWHTPIPRLTFLVGLSCKLNWYLNSKRNAENSFRYRWQDNPDWSQEENLRAESAYYNALTRLDSEIELNVEADADLWRNALFAFIYKYSVRYSNIDDDQFPEHFVYLGNPPEYGFSQHILMMEVRQRF